MSYVHQTWPCEQQESSPSLSYPKIHPDWRCVLCQGPHLLRVFLWPGCLKDCTVCVLCLHVVDHWGPGSIIEIFFFFFFFLWAVIYSFSLNRFTLFKGHFILSKTQNRIIIQPCKATLMIYSIKEKRMEKGFVVNPVKNLTGCFIFEEFCSQQSVWYQH